MSVFDVTLLSMGVEHQGYYGQCFNENRSLMSSWWNIKLIRCANQYLPLYLKYPTHNDNFAVSRNQESCQVVN